MTQTDQPADVPLRTPNPASDFEWSENTSGVTIRKFLNAAATEVVIPEEIAGRPVTRIGKRAFVRSKLHTVTIAKSITKIGQDAFRDCAALQTVILGDGSVSVCRRAFARCKS